MEVGSQLKQELDNPNNGVHIYLAMTVDVGLLTLHCTPQTVSVWLPTTD